MSGNGTLAYLKNQPALAEAATVLHRDGIGIDDIFAGADVGLALFDSELRLLACNDLYRSLCGYLLEEASTGTTLQDLMRITFRRQNVSAEDIEARVAKIIRSLEPGASYTFRYASPSAQVVEVRRRRLTNGTVVETARHVDAPASGIDLNTQFEMIAERSRARLMHALDVMADGFALYDASDRLVLYNRKYVDYSPLVSDIIMPGAAKEEILKASVRRGAFVLNGMSEDDYIAWRLHKHRNPGDPIEVQLSDGRWILISEKRTHDGGIVGTRSDITELKHREIEMLRISQQLHAKNLQFDSAIENMIQGLCMFDKDQRLVVVNRRYLEIYGFSADVVKPGITLRGLMEYSVSLGNYTVEEAERALAERNDPERLRTRTTIKQRLKDGRIIAVMNEPMPDGGTIATYQDITDAETASQTMLDYTRKLERSNRELVDFAYVASHDLQEPLRKIEAFGDRLVRKYAADLPEEGRMFVNRMQSAAERMRLLISDLLSYSRITTAANPFSRNDLTEVVSGVLSDLQIRIEESEATVKVGALPKIECDPMQMRQLFQNLIGNALKFRQKEVAPVIEVTAEVVHKHGLAALGPAVVIRISDNGIGFDNQFKEQIFTIFQRLHSRNEYEGTGIGLATCRKIVERHQGMIDATGRPGEGSTFEITIPVNQGQLEEKSA
ncbi:MAG: PAS domain-containing protein [Rhizobiales bacterium]|nr:PAS domain-containing protein [Hyphomicrobiales bacterium]